MSDGKMWGARFSGELDERFAAFQDSLQHDLTLAFSDLDTNLAWSEALCDAGVISEEDLDSIAAAVETCAT